MPIDEYELPGALPEGLPGTSPADETDLERSQRPMEVDHSKYFETGFVGIMRAKDGLPLIAGTPPLGPEPGLSDDNFVCSKAEATGRPGCKYYGAILTPAAGVARGFEPMKQIRRFCKRLSTASELFELSGDDVYACTMRSPKDERSLAVIEGFEAKQKQVAAEAAETSGKLDF